MAANLGDNAVIGGTTYVIVRIQSFAQLAPVGTLLGLAVKFQLHPIIQDRLPSRPLLLRQFYLSPFLLLLHSWFSDRIASLISALAETNTARLSA